MKNFEVLVENKKHWISRSVSVTAVIFTWINDNLHVLANKRGSGTPDFQGYWNCPCGYLDYDETIKEACHREVLEECGMDINMDQLRLYEINSNPKRSNKQNVSCIFTGTILKKCIEQDAAINGEDNEVAECKWIPVTDVPNYKWAFNHDFLIKEILLDNDRRIYY